MGSTSSVHEMVGLWWSSLKRPNDRLSKVKRQLTWTVRNPEESLAQASNCRSFKWSKRRVLTMYFSSQLVFFESEELLADPCEGNDAAACIGSRAVALRLRYIEQSDRQTLDCSLITLTGWDDGDTSHMATTVGRQNQVAASPGLFFLSVR